MKFNIVYFLFILLGALLMGGLIIALIIDRELGKLLLQIGLIFGWGIVVLVFVMLYSKLKER